ncbi:MAG: hypothetical protein MJ094_09615 [Saccharofermentans sp.]|nr:hypothetical protein [Saccharofermentans sp.]
MKESERSEVFARLNRICRYVIEEADVLNELINYMDDRESIARKISSIEDKADVEMHTLHFYYQNESLLRDSEAMLIYEVAYSVEDCTDAIDDVCEAIIRYNVIEMNDTLATAIYNVIGAAAKVSELIGLIQNIQANKTPTRQIIELDRFKIEYKKVYDEAVKDLFTNDYNPVEVLRMHKVYDAFMDVYKTFELVSEKCGKYSIFMD